MKLLNKTSLIILTVSLFIFFLGGITFYKIIRSMIIKRVDRELVNQQQILTGELKNLKMQDSTCLVTGNKVQIERMNAGFQMLPLYKDTVLFDNSEKLFVPHRMLRFRIMINGTNFRISIFQSMLEAESLIEQIVFTMILMLLTLILAMILLNRYFFRKIWDDFFFALDKVKLYNLRDDPNLDLPYTEVEEFRMLNQVFEKLTERIHKDYQSMKEFTENASHEVQTPLSIMRTKIELLLQYSGYSQEQVDLISSLNEAVNRLSNINKVLILLTRIDNNQFPELSKVHLKERIEYHLENFKEVIEDRNISSMTDLNSEVAIRVNTALADILIINLIKNAIRHNFNNGKLNIRLGVDFLEISNTGPVHDIPAEQIFNRFVKSKNAVDSLGLGLSLVKKICELYEFDIQYNYEEGLHKVMVVFNTEKTPGGRIIG